MKPSSSGVKTLPIGFIGLLSTIALVRGPKAASERGARQRPMRRLQPDQPPDAAQHRHHREIGVVERLDQHDLVAGVDQRHQRGGDRFGRARGHHHLCTGSMSSP